MFVIAAFVVFFVAVGGWGKQSYIKPHQVSDFLEFVRIHQYQSFLQVPLDWGVVPKYGKEGT